MVFILKWKTQGCFTNLYKVFVQSNSICIYWKPRVVVMPTLLELKAIEAGTVFCMCPANGGWCYTVTLSLIGWVHTQNDHYGSCHYNNPWYNQWPQSWHHNSQFSLYVKDVSCPFLLSIFHFLHTTKSWHDGQDIYCACQLFVSQEYCGQTDKICFLVNIHLRHIFCMNSSMIDTDNLAMICLEK